MVLKSCARFALLLLIAACATDRPTGPIPSELPFRSGALTGSTIGPVGPPQTTTSANVTLTGLAGSFTRLSMSVAGNATERGLIYFSSPDTAGHDRLWRIKASGTGLRQLTSDSFDEIMPSVSNDGEKVVFVRPGPAGQSDLWLWSPDDGSRLLAGEINVLANPAWVPGDTAIIYPSFRLIAGDTSQGLYRRNLTTTAVDTLTHGPDQLATVFLGDFPASPYFDTANARHGVPTAIFARRGKLYQLDLNTLDTVLYLDFGLSQLSAPQVSADGRKILYWSTYQGRSELTAGTISPPFEGLITAFPSTAAAPEARWLPDGLGVVVLADDSAVSPPTSQLFLVETVGMRLSQLTSMPRGVHNFFSVGRLLPAGPQQLIGEQGTLGGEASGIIFGTAAGGRITSVVAFAAGNPRSVRITAETGLNSRAPVLQYTLRADRLTALRYIGEPPFDSVVTVLDTTTAPAAGALISFDATTGRVASILAFGAGARPGVTASQRR